MKKALEAGIKHCSLFEKYLTHLPEMVDFYYKQKIILQVMLDALDDEPEKPKSNESEQKIDFKYLEKNIFNLCCRYSLQHDMNDDEILGDFSFKLAKSIKDYFEHDKEPNKPESKKSVTDYLLNYAVNIPEPEKPEPQGRVEELAKFMHDVYEDKSKSVGWSTQESCRVDWDDLPVTNKIVMRYVAYNVMQLLKTKPAIDPEIKMVYEKLRHISILFSDEQWLKNDDGTISPIRQSIFDMWQAIKTHVGGNRGKQC
jgi:hypothetical protein